jgi:hypothetical protein
MSLDFNYTQHALVNKGAVVGTSRKVLYWHSTRISFMESLATLFQRQQLCCSLQNVDKDVVVRHRTNAMAKERGKGKALDNMGNAGKGPDNEQWYETGASVSDAEQ